MINVSLLLRVADAISKHPEQFWMQDWDCGSTACIAGWVLRLSGKRHGVHNGSYASGSDAANLLGLDDWKADQLFTLTPLTNACWSCDDPVQRAALGVKVIHDFLDLEIPGWRAEQAKLQERTP